MDDGTRVPFTLAGGRVDWTPRDPVVGLVRRPPNVEARARKPRYEREERACACGCGAIFTVPKQDRQRFASNACSKAAGAKLSRWDAPVAGAFSDDD